jgi:hypothetical protein
MGNKRKRASVRNAKKKKASRVPRTPSTPPLVRQLSDPPPLPRSKFQLLKAGPAKWVISGLTALGVAASIASAFPRFSVAPGAPLKPTDVLSTPFLVTYDGWLPLRNVTYWCSLEFVQFKEHIILEQLIVGTSDGPRSISSGEAQTASCNGRESALRPLFSGATVQSARVMIFVKYSPRLLPFWRLDVAFRFATVSQSDGALRFVRRLD